MCVVKKPNQLTKKLTTYKLCLKTVLCNTEDDRCSVQTCLVTSHI